MTTAALSRLVPELTIFERDVIQGLSRRQKTLPAKYFYDENGSQLFQQITQLPEYYPTRTEVAILREQRASISSFVGPGAIIVEYGAGSSEKAALLATGLDEPSAYVCVEIEAGAAAEAAYGVSKAVPGLSTKGIVGDFTALDQCAPALPMGRRVGFFPGSTIGNFEPARAAALLAKFARHLGEGARLIVGFDRVKSPEVLVPAYNDAAGVTAAFNKNVLARINRELDGAFDLDAFEHHALWNGQDRRIEMHLISKKAQTADVLGRSFAFRRGETIHTENSYKFDVADIKNMARAAGWSCDEMWTDPDELFLVAGLSR